MQKDEALQVISQVCAVYKGTLADHQRIQEALAVLKEPELKKKEK